MDQYQDDPAVDEPRNALLHLHSLAGGLGGQDPSAVPGFVPPEGAAEALRTVAEADENVVTVAGRLHVLHDLATADFRADDEADAAYRLLAGSIAEIRGVDADQLLDDVKESASEDVPFDQTTTGQALPHRDVAFIGQDICTTRAVEVDGLRAAWIFSEFETDAPFDQVADWVDPRNWPERGPMMFKRMELVGSDEPTPISKLGKQHWHGVFHEQVQLVTQLNTLLHCDHWRDDTAAGMTYKLDMSLDGEIDVDRGFLSVEDVDDVRRVRVLKIVGFTTDEWDDVALMVCPYWTDWVRGAVEGGSSSKPGQPADAPAGGPSGVGDAIDAWIRFMGDAATDYLDLFADMANRATAGESSGSAWLADGTAYWSKLAKDWATAWTYGLEALEEVASQGLDAGLTPPGTDRSTGRGTATRMTARATSAAAPGQSTMGEGTTVPLPGLTADDDVVCKKLTSIESGGAVLSDVSVTVVPLGDGTFGAHVRTTDTAAASGLYVGTVQTPGGKVQAPVQLYVARAREAGQA